MSRASRSVSTVVGALVAASVGLVASSAAAQDIKTPDGHPDYRLELEAHATVSVFRRGLIGFKGGRGDYFGVPGFGGGIRASIEIADPAFIPKLNDTIGITFGMDVTSCTDACKNDAVLYFPVALQWNFFFSKEWSAFGEVGPMIRADLGDEVLPDLYGEAGGRYLFGSDGALVLRIGFPFVTFGGSLFF